MLAIFKVIATWQLSIASSTCHGRLLLAILQHGKSPSPLHSFVTELATYPLADDAIWSNLMMIELAEYFVCATFASLFLLLFFKLGTQVWHYDYNLLLSVLNYK